MPFFVPGTLYTPCVGGGVVGPIVGFSVGVGEADDVVGAALEAFTECGLCVGATVAFG